jgi:hypothetical protein
MIRQSLHRLAIRSHGEPLRRVSFDEAAGEVCTATCRREARLDSVHRQAQYFTLINR